jgi:hypothetical protein
MELRNGTISKNILKLGMPLGEHIRDGMKRMHAKVS